MVKNEFKTNILKFKSISDRVARLDLKFENTYLSIVQTYAPTGKASDQDVETFYNEVRRSLDDTLENLI